MSNVRRKLAIASYGAPREGNIYGTLRLDASPALKYIEYLRQTTGRKVSITHLVGKAVGMGLAATPTLNGQFYGVGIFRMIRWPPHFWSLQKGDATWLRSR